MAFPVFALLALVAVGLLLLGGVVLAVVLLLSPKTRPIAIALLAMLVAVPVALVLAVVPRAVRTGMPSYAEPAPSQLRVTAEPTRVPITPGSSMTPAIAETMPASEIRIDVDPEKLKGYGVTFSDVSSAVTSAIGSSGSVSVDAENSRIAVRAPNSPSLPAIPLQSPPSADGGVRQFSLYDVAKIYGAGQSVPKTSGHPAHDVTVEQADTAIERPDAEASDATADQPDTPIDHAGATADEPAAVTDPADAVEDNPSDATVGQSDTAIESSDADQTDPAADQPDTAVDQPGAAADDPAPVANQADAPEDPSDATVEQPDAVIDSSDADADADASSGAADQSDTAVDRVDAAADEPAAIDQVDTESDQPAVAEASDSANDATTDTAEEPGSVGEPTVDP